MKLQLWLLVDSHFSSIPNHHLLDFPFHTVVPDVSFIGDVVQNVTEADQLQFMCSVVEAWPQPNIVWLLNNSKLKGSEQPLPLLGQAVSHCFVGDYMSMLPLGDVKFETSLPCRRCATSTGLLGTPGGGISMVNSMCLFSK